MCRAQKDWRARPTSISAAHAISSSLNMPTQRQRFSGRIPSSSAIGGAGAPERGSGCLRRAGAVSSARGRYAFES